MSASPSRERIEEIRREIANPSTYELALREAAERLVSASRVEARGFAAGTKGAADAHDRAIAEFYRVLRDTPYAIIANIVLQLPELRSAALRGVEDGERLDWMDAQWQEPIHIEVDAKAEFPNGPLRREVTMFAWNDTDYRKPSIREAVDAARHPAP